MISISSAISVPLVSTRASHKRDVLNGNDIASLLRTTFWSSEFRTESSQGT